MLLAGGLERICWGGVPLPERAVSRNLQLAGIAGCYSFALTLVASLALAQMENAPATQSTPPAGAKTPAHMGPHNFPNLGEQHYPRESLKHGEAGRCIVRVQVDPDGGVRAMQLLASTGFARLDQACFGSFINVQLIPASLDGMAVVDWIDVPEMWKVIGSRPPNIEHADLSSVPQIQRDYQLKVGPDYYPPTSLENKEQGICIVHLFVGADGATSAATISQSTGFVELDKNCLFAAQEAPFVPAKQNGAAIGAWTNIIMVWRPRPKRWANDR
jgi:TonB family protein